MKRWEKWSAVVAGLGLFFFGGYIACVSSNGTQFFGLPPWVGGALVIGIACLVVIVAFFTVLGITRCLPELKARASP